MECHFYVLVFICKDHECKNQLLKNMFTVVLPSLTSAAAVATTQKRLVSLSVTVQKLQSSKPKLRITNTDQYKSLMISCRSGCKHQSTSVSFISWISWTWLVTSCRRSVIFCRTLAKSWSESGWLVFSCSSRE